jgi:hypothetical protein
LTFLASQRGEGGIRENTLEIKLVTWLSKPKESCYNMEITRGEMPSNTNFNNLQGIGQKSFFCIIRITRGTELVSALNNGPMRVSTDCSLDREELTSSNVKIHFEAAFSGVDHNSLTG